MQGRGGRAYGDLENIRTADDADRSTSSPNPIDCTDLETTILKTLDEVTRLRKAKEPVHNLPKPFRKRTRNKAKNSSEQFLANIRSRGSGPE